MDTFSFTFKLTEIQYIINCLVDKPFKDVNLLIYEIQKQFDTQIIKDNNQKDNS